MADLVCCVCLYTRTGTADDAVTVIRGYAVCEDHLGLAAQGTEWHAIIATERAQQGPPASPGRSVDVTGRLLGERRDV